MESKWEFKTATENQRAKSLIISTIIVLDGYGQIKTDTLTVRSSPDDGASCGVQLNLGVPQFIAAYKSSENSLYMSNCTCEPPYKALTNYLEKGVDTFIPSLDACWVEKTSKIKNSEKCAVWKGQSDSRGQKGRADYIKHIKFMNTHMPK